MKGEAPTAEAERGEIRLGLDHHHTICLFGPPTTALFRAIQAVCQRHNSEAIEAVYTGKQVDAQVLDGREITPDSLREILKDLSQMAVQWPHRYLFITHLDEPHANVVPILLKLIEEPYPHLKILLTTDRPWLIPETIFSRAVRVDISPGGELEIQRHITGLGLKDISSRAKWCGGDIDVAREMDVDLVRDYQRVWADFVQGATLPHHYTLTWLEKLQKANRSTQQASFRAVLQTLRPHIRQSPQWSKLADTFRYLLSEGGYDTTTKVTTLDNLMQQFHWAHYIRRKK